MRRTRHLHILRCREVDESLGGEVAMLYAGAQWSVLFSVHAFFSWTVIYIYMLTDYILCSYLLSKAHTTDQYIPDGSK